MTRKVRTFLPLRFELSGRIPGGYLQQVARMSSEEEVEAVPYRPGRVSGQLLTTESGEDVLVVPKWTASKVSNNVLLAPHGIPINGEELGDVRWLRPHPLHPNKLSKKELARSCEEVRQSWQDQFRFTEEKRLNGELIQPGLRAPQVGALYASLAHWKVTEKPATVVLPTGTGKTDTMIAILLKQQLERLLVVVPTAALRKQIAAQFLALGILKRYRVVGPEAKFPLVGRLEHCLRSPSDVQDFFQRCNVIVTTMNVVAGCTDDVQVEMARQSTCLFIDEAHHITAPTWEAFRRHFLVSDKPVLQFTATPYRRDGKYIGGKVIFKYPLRKAQEEEYFTRLNFRGVREYDRLRFDNTIAQEAIEQLERDRQAKRDHIIMARTASIDRAVKVHALYQRLASSHNPLLIHSRLPEAEKRRALEAIWERRSRIIVCVDMLGEGFDLPELKIAALHDVHKSLAVTIQFTGRFARAKSSIGDATVIANIADTRVEEALEALYAEDADWNVLLPRLSEGATSRQVKNSDFLEDFVDVPVEFPLQNVYPKMSTVVYRTSCRSWQPHNIRDVVKEDRLYAEPTVNHKDKVLLFVTREPVLVPWGHIKNIHDLVYDLYIMHWSEDQGLLYINSSNNDSVHRELAEAVVGENAELIQGERVFHSLSGISRLILMNLGLSHSLSRAVRFTMYVGSDIKEGLSQASFQNRWKTNIFGRGYEHGEKASMGCSRKGRIWSYKVAGDILEWVDWCHKVGAKLLDDSISVRKILEHVLIPKQMQKRPSFVPLCVEWSEYFLMRSEETFQIDVSGEVVYFYEVGMEIVEFSAEGPIRFRVFTDTTSADYEVVFREKTVEYVPMSEEKVNILTSRSRTLLSEWFQKEPPIIRFENGAFLVYNNWFESLGDNRTPFSKEKIESWDWDGIDLTKESHFKVSTEPPLYVERSDSIQYRAFEYLLEAEHDPQYDIVFDDDDTNEAADIVALKVADEKLLVHFYHCKYSTKDKSGARVDDLYAVCGQAQRSVYWKHNVRGLFTHLQLRESRRQMKYGTSRFRKGNLQKLEEISRHARFLIPEFSIFIIQPGLSKGAANNQQLELLGATELYLQEVIAAKLRVIAST